MFAKKKLEKRRANVNHRSLTAKNPVTKVADKQVFWLPDRPPTAPSRLSKAVVLAVFVPGYSGGSAVAFHHTSLFCPKALAGTYRVNIRDGF
jgi:hypothetical protein